jgi:hypothetical protein
MKPDFSWRRPRIYIALRKTGMKTESYFVILTSGRRPLLGGSAIGDGLTPPDLQRRLLRFLVKSSVLQVKEQRTQGYPTVNQRTRGARPTATLAQTDSKWKPVLGVSSLTAHLCT